MGVYFGPRYAIFKGQRWFKRFQNENVCKRFLAKNENMCTAQKAAASHLSTTIFSPFRMTSSSVHHLPPLALEMRLQRVQSKYAFLLGEKGKIKPDVLLHEIVKNNNIDESFEHEDMELCLKTVGFGKDPDTENNRRIE